MQLEVGKIYEGKVTGITKFGAFVELDPQTTGMVHISEVANTFVQEIKDHVQEGQTVKVKVLSLGEDGKISLSIKKALPQQPGDRRRPAGPRGQQRPGQQSRGPQRQTQRPQRTAYERPEPQDLGKNPPPVYSSESSGDRDFEDMMSRFKAASDEKFSDLKRITDNKRRSSSRRK